MFENSETGRVVIVGGGLAGMAAATYLARAGRLVTVFERSHQVGGRAITKRYGEFYFNEGPHALYRGGKAQQVLDELGIKYKGGKVSGKGYEGFYRGELCLLPVSISTLLTSRFLGWKGRFELAKLFGKIGTINPAKLERQTVQEWVEANFRDERARELVLAICRTATYTNAPTLQSASAFVTQLKMVLKTSVLYLDHGWQTLVDGLAQAAQKAGAEIVTGAKVVAVEHNDRVRGVRLDDGTVYPASSVLIAASPRIASELVDEGRHPNLSAYAERAVPVQAATLEVGLRRLPDPRHRVIFGLDSPLYYSVHSNYADLGPEGSAMIHLAKYLNPAEPPAPKEVEQELEALLDKAQPGWREVLIQRRYLPHMIVSNAIVAATDGGFGGRPGPQVAGISGLYLAGDWVGPEGQLSDAGLASARQATRLILQASNLAGAPESLRLARK